MTASRHDARHPTPPGAMQPRLAWALSRRFTRALARSLAYPRSPDDYLQALNRDWAWERVTARVDAIQRETAETTSIYLTPSRTMRPHRAGQHVLLTVVLDGVEHRRCFSLSAAYCSGAPLRLTIKAHAGGRVSGWARDAVRVGDRLQLSQPQGDFVLPDPVPRKLLFLSGGSGMTPLLAMAQELVSAGYDGCLRWIHRERSQVALLDELTAVCTALGGRLEVDRTAGREAVAASPPLDLAERVPDYRERHLFVCGPRGLTDAALALYAEAGCADRAHHEDFQLRRARVLPLRAPGAQLPRLVLARSSRAIDAQPGASILESAERAGLSPPHGCRRGICHTCTCIKRRGTVRNEITGVESDAPDEEIRICIHSAITDVTIEL